jgi:hypothetical protein
MALESARAVIAKGCCRSASHNSGDNRRNAVLSLRPTAAPRTKVSAAAARLTHSATLLALASSTIERMIVLTTSACAVCRRSLRKRRAATVDGLPHCTNCALLVAIARAMVRAAAVVVTVALCASPAAADLPNASLTPGAVADTDATIVCAYGYARAHRNVPYAERDRVYNEYGIPRGTRSASPRRGYRIDHLVPLELGGANDERNLWPQTFADSERKDRVESALHAAVCYEHRITLQQAQAAIARDWQHTPVGVPK